MDHTTLVEYAENAGKANNVQDLKDVSVNCGQFNCSGQTKKLAQNIKTVDDYPGLVVAQKVKKVGH